MNGIKFNLGPLVEVLLHADRDACRKSAGTLSIPQSPDRTPLASALSQGAFSKTLSQHSFSALFLGLFLRTFYRSPACACRPFFRALFHRPFLSTLVHRLFFRALFQGPHSCLQAPPLMLSLAQAQCLATVCQAAHLILELAPSSRSTLLSVNAAMADRHPASVSAQRVIGGSAIITALHTQVRTHVFHHLGCLFLDLVFHRLDSLLQNTSEQ